MKPRSKATDVQVRRAGYLVAAVAVLLAAYSVYVEIDYADFASKAKRIDARIVDIEAFRTGKRLDHELHYEVVLDGQAHQFSDCSGKDTKLEDLYTGTFNAFTDADSPIKVGRTIRLLVNPKDAADHRPDREALASPAFLWLRTLLSLLFLSGMAAALLWAGRASKPLAQGDQSAPRTNAGKSEVSSSSANGKSRVRVRLDVPFPQAQASSAAQDKLRERMRELQAQRGDEVASASTTASTTPAHSMDIELQLDVAQDAQLQEAYVELLDGTRRLAREVLSGRLSLQAGSQQRMRASLTAQGQARRYRVVVMLTDQSSWEHEAPLG